MKDFNIKKLYYSISEVSKITEVEDYVLRYWETEFEGLKPQKNRAGNRAYTHKDIQLILVIKNLLRDKKFTIEGAKKILSEIDDIESYDTSEQNDTKSFTKAPENERLNEQNDSLRAELIEIKSILESILKKIS